MSWLGMADKHRWCVRDEKEVRTKPEKSRVKQKGQMYFYSSLLALPYDTLPLHLTS